MGDQKSKSKKPELSQSSQFTRYTGLGFQWLATFAAFGWLGYMLDQSLNTLPLFLTIFILIALVGNIYLIIRSNKQ